MKIEQLGFVLHFDATESEISSLWSMDALVESFQSAFDSIDLSRAIDRSSEDVSIDFDPDFSNPTSYFDLLQGTVNFSTLSASFEGTISQANQTGWDFVRRALLELRNQQFEPGAMWGAFNEAPVTVSLEFVHLSEAESPQTININSRDVLLKYLEELESSASSRTDVSEFLTHYSSEIAQFRNGTSSNFMNFWFSTEIMLTQKTLDHEAPSAESRFINPILKVEHFDWECPDVLNVLVEADRAESVQNTFWFTPLSANMYSPNSDFYWFYEKAREAGVARDPNAAAYSPLRFALTMQALKIFAEENDIERSGFELANFLTTYSDDIEELISQIDEEFGWEDPTPQDSEKAEFVRSLELPENTEQIWNAYLKVIGVTE